MFEIVTSLLKKTSRLLTPYLEETLSSENDNWWYDTVFIKLSYQQQKHVEQICITQLTSLDLAALLRIFDQNWFDISAKKSLPREYRNYIKEMQSVRNRWAHMGSDSIHPGDTYRDLDTLERFLTPIVKDNELLTDIQAAKEKILSKGSSSNFPPPTSQTSNDTENQEEFEFKLGQLVVLRSDPDVSGAVVEIIKGEYENSYSIFTGKKSEKYYASQLRTLEQLEEKIESLSLPLFHAHMSALLLTHPCVSALYSLNAARIDYIPYQFRPVMKFIRSERPRLLIADSVGVGKTIEAGLILRELQARREIESVLIICPKALVTEKKWQNEMKRFDEDFIHFDGKLFRYCIEEMDHDGEWPDRYSKGIIPHSLFDEKLLHGKDGKKSRKGSLGLLKLDPPPRFDLVIVDEAHHIRNSDTFLHQGVRFFCENAEAVLFLTATPIQLGSHDLFTLLNILRPDLILDKQSFDHMAAPNPFINKAATLVRAQTQGWQEEALEELLNAAATPWGLSMFNGNPEFKEICEKLQQDEINQDERIASINNIENLHTFSGIINRTRRRDIGKFTIRRSFTIPVNFTPEQQQLHDQILEVQAKIYKSLHGSQNVKFMMTTIRRQTASCLYGLAPFLREILTRRFDDLAMEEIDNSYDGLEDSGLDQITGDVKNILRMVKLLPPHDPKLDKLKEIITEKQESLHNKIMLFSSFRHTLRYLFGMLGECGLRVGMIHGGTPDDERLTIRELFMLPRENKAALDLLLFSEVGCEGLDYQFCDCMVNYDLPWNPMRVEQRIGRIDRNGQLSEAVMIYNMITPGTVDADIYERCLLRIGVFENALGGNEEILGEIAHDVANIANNPSLTVEERQFKLQQLADNKVRTIQEEQELEEKEYELFGIRLPKDKFTEDVENASNYWLKPHTIQNLVNYYLKKTCGHETEYILGEKPLKTLRLSYDARNSLLIDLKQLNRQNSEIFRRWEKWLKGSEQHLSITFETECASNSPSATLLMSSHPLVIRASAALEPQERFFTAIQAYDSSIPKGKYAFSLYQWQYKGIREDLFLCPVSENEIVSQKLIELFENGNQNFLDEEEYSKDNVFNDLDNKHYVIWDDARKKHKEKVLRLVDFKKESLFTSHSARINLLTEQLNAATDEKIKRMRQSQIESAQRDFELHLKELEIGAGKADIAAQVIAFGYVFIVPGVVNAK